MLIRLSGRDDPDDGVIFSVTMANNQNAEFETHAEHDESVFVLRMVGIEETNGILIEKYRLCFLERDAMFPYVFPVLVFIPFETKVIHIYNVCIL